MIVRENIKRLNNNKQILHMGPKVFAFMWGAGYKKHRACAALGSLCKIYSLLNKKGEKWSIHNN